MKPSHTSQVARLLSSMFRSDELRRFTMLHYKEIHDGIHWDAPHHLLAAEVADALERHGLIDARLYDRLTAERPRRAREIAGSSRRRPVVKAVAIGVFALGGALAVERGIHGWSNDASDAGASVRHEEASRPSVEAAERPEAEAVERVAPPCPPDMILVTPDSHLYGEHPPFCLDVHEVSRQQFGLRCPSVERGGVHEQLATSRAQYCDRGAPDPRWGQYPVVLVTAGEARSFCEKQGRRLPTAREWFMAAAMDLDGRRAGEFLTAMNLCGGECPRSERVPLYTFRHKDAYERLAPVGAFRDVFPSRLGLQDMYGNAREIVQRDEVAVACGASWQSYAKEFLAPELCTSGKPAPLGVMRFPDVGFRCARDVSSAP